MVKIVITVIFLATVSSCATVGEKFAFTGPREIRINKTTQSQIIRRHGTPFRVGYDSGLIQWTYAYYKYSLFAPAQTKDLVITFNKNRTVKSYVYNSSYEDDKMKIMSK